MGRVLAAFGSEEVQADLAIVGEPTRLVLATAHKGSDVARSRDARSLAAHGATPWFWRQRRPCDGARRGRVANWLCRATPTEKNHPLLGHGTVSVGTIHGGTQTNIVPTIA